MFSDNFGDGEIVQIATEDGDITNILLDIWDQLHS